MMVALVAVAFTAVAQAASFNWSTSGTNAAKTFYGPDGSTIAGAMVYLLDTATIDQGALVTAIRGGASIESYAAATSQALDTNSRLSSGKEFTFGTAGNAYNFYMAIVKDDYVFVSDSILASAQASDVSDVKFSGIKTATSANLGSADYSTAGWYQSVPEPTSGLLLLLGMAGLALKRKQA